MVQIVIIPVHCGLLNKVRLVNIYYTGYFILKLFLKRKSNNNCMHF